MKTQLVPISKVIPYANNPRRNEAVVAKVAASIKEFGFRQPVVVDKDMVIIAGHTRLEAARQLGEKKVPIHIADNLTKAQAKAYRLADNRIAQEAEWDYELLSIEMGDLLKGGFDMSVIGFNDAEIADILEDDDSEPTDLSREWTGMPSFNHEDKTAFRSIIIHMKDQAAVDQFAKTVNLNVTPRTKMLWFPEIEIETTVDKVYKAKE